MNGLMTAIRLVDQYDVSFRQVIGIDDGKDYERDCRILLRWCSGIRSL